MDPQMFCFQCEQTAGCSGCTGKAGVCGKTAADAASVSFDNSRRGCRVCACNIVRTVAVVRKGHAVLSLCDWQTSVLCDKLHGDNRYNSAGGSEQRRKSVFRTAQR